MAGLSPFTPMTNILSPSIVSQLNEFVQFTVGKPRMVKDFQG